MFLMYCCVGVALIGCIDREVKGGAAVVPEQGGILPFALQNTDALELKTLQ